MNNPSKLQSEAVNKLYELSGGADDYGHCMVDVEKAIPFIQDQIQKAYKAGIKEVLRNVEYNAQTKIWEIPEEKLLSIQSKGKIK